MRVSLVVSVAFLLALSARNFAGTPDVRFLFGFLAGDYRLVGQQSDSGAAYAGRVSLRERDGRFEVTRTIAGTVTRGTAAIEKAGEGTTVLRARFAVAGVNYEATYLWRSDLDNYPRLTGYVYRTQGRTESPGLEALFHIPPTPDK